VPAKAGLHQGIPKAQDFSAHVLYNSANFLIWPGTIREVNYIELFAGCGGLSLGLRSVGFDLVMANELSPMAAETYAYNFFNENLKTLSESSAPRLEKALWLSSRYQPADLKLRLRENPREYPRPDAGISDILTDGSNLKGSLVVGSIVALNVWLKQNQAVARDLRDGFGAGGVDLVSGGPPCQSFSMAGLRRMDCEKNALPWEFAEFVSTVQPKLVLLENVSGILRPFKDDLGNSYYAWYELAKAFSEKGYVPLCLHVNAKLAGVPQNRPRFILIGLREDFYQALAPTFNKAEQELFAQPLEFFTRTKSDKDIPYGGLGCRDVANAADFRLFKNSFLAPLVAFKDRLVTVRLAIDDLRAGGDTGLVFPRKLAKTFGKVLRERSMENHVARNNGYLVRRRFRLYQNLQQAGNGTRKRILSLLNGHADDVSDADWVRLKDFDYMDDSLNSVKFSNKKNFVGYLRRHPTKKQTQKALLADDPAPAALSIPDDACHYHRDELRTLSVREMARIQSFPDNFEFRSKATTGGHMRSFEVPQYTQVGNAVPPLLARALGTALSNLLERPKDSM
jgi:DNA (cytosine-5)-methyltransferase 1